MHKGPSGTPFSLIIAPGPDDIDELGHVNNAVWVRWNAVADPAHIAAYIWVVTRHEIDYRGNIGLGDRVTGRTWIETPPKGAQFDRRVDFIDAAGNMIVRANTTWAMIDKVSGRLARVRPEIAVPFLGEPAQS